MTADSAQSSVLESRYYTPEEFSLLNPDRIPKHIAIIMDGNRRWANLHNLPPIMGHWEGAEVLTEIVRAASDLGIKTLTVYSFSTENWSRTQKEVDGLMRLFEVYLIEKRATLLKEDVKVNSIGEDRVLPKKVRNALEETKKVTEKCKKIDLVLALNYGSRDEICRAMQKVLVDYDSGTICKKDITEKLVSQYLDTHHWSDPELLIRTSGEQRLSNFLLWQLAYTEVFVTEVLWPNYTPKDLLRAVLEYQKRERRLGGS